MIRTILVISLQSFAIMCHQTIHETDADQTLKETPKIIPWNDSDQLMQSSSFKSKVSISADASFTESFSSATKTLVTMESNKSFDGDRKSDALSNDSHTFKTETATSKTYLPIYA